MLETLQSAPWWMLALAAFGALALVAAVLTLFSGFGDRPPEARITRGCGYGSDDFLLGLAGTVNAPLERGGTARLLNDGEYFPRLLEAIERAERSINFMVYIWEPGAMSDRLFDALERRARDGVQVRVMVDALGGHMAPEERIERLCAAGGQWARFHPLRFGKLTRFHKRNHRRAIVVDGRVGFTGGMAVADKWLGDAEGADHWRDAMVEVRGCIATNLQSAFAQLWAHVTGEVLIGEEFYPPDHPEDAEQASGEPISRHVNVVSSPSNEAHPLRIVFWLSIHAARERLYITNPYFVPDDIMWAVLEERARAGVDVRVLVPNEHIDVKLIRWASHTYYESLLGAGVRIYEYQPTMIHQKLLVGDGMWSLVGSANMDVRSKELNQENVLGILDRGFAGQVEQTFLADLERAREVRLDEFRRRPWWRRIPEQLSLLFEEQA